MSYKASVGNFGSLIKTKFGSFPTITNSTFEGFIPQYSIIFWLISDNYFLWSYLRRVTYTKKIYETKSDSPPDRDMESHLW